MAAKWQLIEEVLGKALEQEGFYYSGSKKKNWRFEGSGGECWLFERQDGEWIQLVVISDFQLNKTVWVEIDEIKKGEDPWEAYGYGVTKFKEKESIFDEGKLIYKDMETFKDALVKVKIWIWEYFLPGFVQLRQPRYKYCVTESIRDKVYRYRAEFLKELKAEYGIKTMREDSLIQFMKNLVHKYRGKNMEEFEAAFLKLSVCLGEFFVSIRSDCHWEWDDFYKLCGIRAESETGSRINPLEIIFDEWIGKSTALENCYEREIVRWRKRGKSLRLYDMKSTGNRTSFREGKYVDTYLIDFMKTIHFTDDFWNGKGEGIAKGWKFKREGDGKADELWFIRGYDTDELWVKGITKSGKMITVHDRREGLAPYDSRRYCRTDDDIYFPSIMKELMEQAEELLPVLEDEKKYLPKYDLSPEMERSQFWNHEKLLERLAGKYEIEGMKKEELPGFVKKVLRENEGKTMDEFGETLLGLGVLLGETAIEGKEDRHWLWDKTHASCIVTSGDEIFGIAPAFALNYAWQKEKPENVDRLCEDLFGDWEWIKGGVEKCQR